MFHTIKAAYHSFMCDFHTVRHARHLYTERGDRHGRLAETHFDLKLAADHKAWEAETRKNQRKREKARKARRARR